MSGRHEKSGREQGYYGPSLTDVTKGAITLALCGALVIALLCAACAATYL